DLAFALVVDVDDCPCARFGERVGKPQHRFRLARAGRPGDEQVVREPRQRQVHATAPGWEQSVAGELVAEEGAASVGGLLSRGKRPALDPTLHAGASAVTLVDRARP